MTSHNSTSEHASSKYLTRFPNSCQVQQIRDVVARRISAKLTTPNFYRALFPLWNFSPTVTIHNLSIAPVPPRPPPASLVFPRGGGRVDEVLAECGLGWFLKSYIKFSFRNEHQNPRATPRAMYLHLTIDTAQTSSAYVAQPHDTSNAESPHPRVTPRPP